MWVSKPRLFQLKRLSKFSVYAVDIISRIVHGLEMHTRRLAVRLPQHLSYIGHSSTSMLGRHSKGLWQWLLSKLSRVSDLSQTIRTLVPLFTSITLDSRSCWVYVRQVWNNHTWLLGFHYGSVSPGAMRHSISCKTKVRQYQGGLCVLRAFCVIAECATDQIYQAACSQLSEDCQTSSNDAFGKGSSQESLNLTGCDCNVQLVEYHKAVCRQLSNNYQTGIGISD